MRRRAVMLVLAALAVAPATALAAMHLRLVRAEPAVNGTITRPPTVIRLVFSQQPELATTSVRLRGPDSAQIALGPVRRDTAGNVGVAAEIRGKTGPGRYTVSWRTMARDGHVMRGEYAFTVVPQAGAAGR